MVGGLKCPCPSRKRRTGSPDGEYERISFSFEDEDNDDYYYYEEEEEVEEEDNDQRKPPSTTGFKKDLYSMSKADPPMTVKLRLHSRL
ncbi:hypothetical protein V1478_005841 [Vespula squamosa]|uniref:Uncharacterized protein n=1 Tax=Vespula squamosa TaxID=30214 RepID=A0ABD2B9Y5_VESSQ